MKLFSFMRRCGPRRIFFVAFCLTLVLAAALYLKAGPHPGDYGFGSFLPPAMAMFLLLAIASPWMITQYRLPVLAEAPAKKLESWSERTGFWCGVAIAILVALVIWKKRMGTSLWTDEVTSVRENIVGRWKHRNDDEGSLKRPSIGDTFFEYETPNNHSLYSAVTRWLHESTVGINDSDFSKPYFNETVLRLPALIAALLTLPLIGYLALRLHSLLAAWLAMSWAVLHPWFLEFSTSARGYTFAMGFLALSAVALVRIFRCGGSWRWWAIYGLSQFLAFFSVTTVAHALILFNIAAFAALLFDKSINPKSRRPHLCAFFVVNLSAAAGAFVTFMPKKPQFEAYIASGHFRFEMKWEWMEDCLSNFFIGQPFVSWSESNPWSYATNQWPAAVLIVGIAILLGALVMAFRRAWRGGVFTFLFALAMILPPFTVYFQARAMQFYFFPWYSSWQLPLWLVLCSIGAVALIKTCCKRAPKWLTPTLTVVFVGMIALATHNERHAFLSVAVEPQRESAAFMRTSPNPYAPGHEEVITVSIVTANHAYDPWNRRVRDVDALLDCVADAEKTGRPLFCDTAWTEALDKGIEALVMDQDYFVRVTPPLSGLQVQNTRYVLRYVPGSLLERLVERRREQE